MILISGIRLDDHHVAALGSDYSGASAWYLFTFEDPIPELDKSDTYEFEVRGKDNGNLFTITTIDDPGNFEWNGRKIRLEV